MFANFLAVVSEITKVPVDKLHENLSFRDDLGIDSLQLVNLLVEVAQQFNIELSSIQSVEDLETVGKLYSKLIQRGQQT